MNKYLGGLWKQKRLFFEKYSKGTTARVSAIPKLIFLLACFITWIWISCNANNQREIDALINVTVKKATDNGDEMRSPVRDKSNQTQYRTCTSEPSLNTIIFRENLSKVNINNTVFEIIIITHNRPHSLGRCLKSAQQAFYDRNVIKLSVWIDRFRKDGTFDEEVVQVAKNFSWFHGEKVIHLWDTHVGLYGQWVDTFVPTLGNERAIILEDDLDLSPYYYIWLKGATKAYTHRGDIFGYTLQRARLRADQRVL